LSWRISVGGAPLGEEEPAIVEFALIYKTGISPLGS